MINILRFGESALLVNFEQKIAIATSKKVFHLYHALKEVDGVDFLIPAYCSLTVGYNSTLIGEMELKTLINSHVQKPNFSTTNRHLKIPVCYDQEFGLDLQELCDKNKLNLDEVIRLHTDMTYYVYMMGFIPGFAYLGKTHDQLHVNRKSEPRKKVAARSVALAGAQTGIYPTDAPGGWQIIGKTPVQVVHNSQQQPFLFRPTDKVNFFAIDKKEYIELEKAYAAGGYEIEISNE